MVTCRRSWDVSYFEITVGSDHLAWWFFLRRLCNACAKLASLYDGAVGGLKRMRTENLMNGREMEVKDRNGNTMSLVDLFCKWKSACQRFLSKTGRCHDRRNEHKVASEQGETFAACLSDLTVTSVVVMFMTCNTSLVSIETFFFRRLNTAHVTLCRPVFLNRRAAARYRALASIIQGRERFS